MAVLKNGRLLVNAAAGRRGRLDQGPVTPSTLFCGFSLCKAVLSILAHSLVDDGLLSYDAPISSVWPELGNTLGREYLTLRHVLTHSAGLQFAFPHEPTPQKLWSAAAGEEAVLSAQPVTAPGARTSMHYFSFGWLLAGILERASGKPLAQLLKDKISGPLGIEAELLLGPVVVATGKGSNLSKPSLATVEYDLRELVADQLSKEGNVGAAGAELMALVDGGGSDDDAETRGLKDLVSQRLKGREFLLDHRLLNAERLKWSQGGGSGATSSAAGLAGLNGRFSARALADVLESLCRSERPSTTVINRVTSSPDLMRKGGANDTGDQASLEPLLSLERLRDMRSTQSDEEPGFTRLMGREASIRLGMGVQLFGFRQEQANGAVRYSAYGHASACGQLALTDPSTGLVLVVTSNRQPLPGQKNPGFEVLKLVAEELNLGEPLPIW